MKTTFMAVDGQLLTTLPGSQFEPVQEWGDVDGKRRPTGRQATDAAGVPLWKITALMNRVSFGRVEPELVTVHVAAQSAPDADEVLR